MHQDIDTHEFQVQTGSPVPIYSQAAAFLKEKIVSGAYPAGMQMPAETELAQQLGINRMTLRKSLKILASQDLITQVPHHGTFVAKAAPKRLRIGVVYIPPEEAGFTYANSLLVGIGKGIEKFDNVELTYINGEQILRGKAYDFMAGRDCNALIVPIGTRELFQFLDNPKFDRLPMVFINRYALQLKGLRYAVTLKRDAIQMGVDCLIRHGHRRIAYISAESGNPVLDIRNHEFLSYCPEEGSANLEKNPDDWFSYARRKAIEICKSDARPSAILTPGIKFTAGVWHGLRECGLKVPEDVSLLGFDPMDDTFPMISTINQPFEEMAETAVEILRQSCFNSKIYRKHIFWVKAQIRNNGSIARI